MGGDIASASPLVIDTDGNYFDVTGTTSFAAMTVEAGNFFMLQFDGALTITHGSGIELPGAANLTTAAGDRLICYATAANTVEVMNVATEAAAGGGAWSVLSSGSFSASSGLEITGITKTTKIAITVTKDFDGSWLMMQTSSNGGSSFDSGSSNYDFHCMFTGAGSSTVSHQTGQNQTMMLLNTGIGNAAGEILKGEFILIDPQDSYFTHVYGMMAYNDTSGFSNQNHFNGQRKAAAAVNAVKIYATAGSGTITGTYVIYELN